METIKIKHFENGIKEFETLKEFLAFVQMIFKENEEGDDTLSLPQTPREAMLYLTNFCANFEVVEISIK